MQLQSSARILLYMLMFLRVVVLVMEGGGGEWGWLKNRLNFNITILFCTLVFFIFFFYGNKNPFKNLNSLNCVKYHLNKNLFRLTPENVGSYLLAGFYCMGKGTKWWF